MRKNCNITLQDSVGGYQRKHLTVSLGENFAPLASRPGFCSDNLEGQPLNTNGFMFGGQNFQAEHSQQAFLGESTVYDPHFLMLRGLSVLKSHQEYAPIDSPTLTTNSERSEITEASTDFNFLGGSQQLVRGQQQLDTSLLQSMQQSSYNDMQLLQQQMMFKQMQDIQRQQQLQQFDDARQQSSQNQISAFTRQSTGGQYPSYINGTAVSDSSEMFMNRAHVGASSAAQGVFNQLMFSQEKGQSFHSTLLVPQQLDESNYRTPISSGRGSMGQYSQLQGMDRDSCSLLTKASSHCLKPTMQPVVFSSSSIGDMNTVSADHFALSQMGRSKQGFQGKNLFEQIPNHGLDDGIKSGTIQQKNSLQTNASFPEFQGGQDGAGWLGTTQQKVTQLDTSQYFVPLDPIEQKILYNMDHNVWDTSLGKCTNVSNGSFENNLIHSDYSNVFPSIQSGSWSALMQSAVAEASSSDTGIQEEWSGLTFQNTELSTENQHSNIVDSKREQSAWYENSMHSASSLSSRPYPNFNDSSMSSSFPGFQQSGIQPSLEQTEHLCPEDSHELYQNSEKTGEWLDNKNAQKRLGEESQHVQPLEHLNKTLASHIYEQSEYDRPPQQITASHDNINQPHGKPQGRVNEVTHSRRDYHSLSCKADNDFRHLENMKHVNISMNNEENDIMGKKNSQIRDDPIVLQNSFDKAGHSFIEKLQQKDNSRDQYILKQLSSQGQGYFQQSYLLDVSSNAMSLEKGQLAGFQRNLKSSDSNPSRGNLDASTNFCKSTGPNGPNPYNQTSENVLGHLQNVDQSKESSAIPHYSSIGCSPLSMMTEAVFPNPSVSQHYNQSSSQGFAMRLLHPSQQLSYSNKVSSSQGLPQLSSNPNTRPVSSGFVEKNQTLLASPSSIQSMPPSNESLQTAHWDEKSHCLGEAEAATSLFLPPHFVTDENQGQFTSGAPAVRLSPQASLPSTASRYPQFDLASSQDTSRHINSNMCGKQYPVFEAHPISQPLTMSRIGQQGGLLARQQNVWSNNTSQQHNASTEANKIGALNNTLEATSLAPQGFNDQTSQKCGLRLFESDMISTNSHDYDHKDEMPEQRTKSYVYNTSLGDGVARKSTNTNAFPSGLLLVHPHQQDLNRMQTEDKNGFTTSERDSLFVNFSKLPHVVGQQYSLQKVKPLKNVDTEPKGVQDSQQVTAMSNENLARENAKHNGQGFASELNSLPSENRNMLNLLAGGREDYKVKALSENPLNSCSRGFTSDGHRETLNEFNRKNMGGNNEENSQINPLTVSSWFKFRNGQMHNELLAKHPGGHFSLMKPLENLCIQSSLDGTDSADVNQSGRVWSTAATTMGATDHLTAPYGLPSTATVKTAAIVRPKKRKFDSSELQPWHVEVRGSQRIVNISMAEQDWAQTTNRLTEKMVNEVEMVEDGYVMLRSKRRLILTTQLWQQLVCPAPSFILSADASSFYDSVIYFILRSSLGDACSLMCGQRNDLRVSLNNGNVLSKEHETVKCTDDKYLAMIVERFCARAGKLENDLQRLDGTASIVDLMVECQELERFSVINRFAKFHIRQVDVSGNPSSNGLVTLAPKSCPQRYVTAHPIPSHLPEGVQCLSL